MLTAGTAKGDREIALAFVNVMRQQINQQFRDSLNEFLGLRKRTDIFRHFWIAAGQRTKFRHEMRVGQKAHIENEVRIFGNSMAEAEAHARHQNIFIRRLLLETLVNVGAQFVDVELRGVNNEVSQSSYRAEMASFRLKGGLYRSVGAQRRRASRLTEAAHQNGVGSFEVYDFGGNLPPHGLENFRQTLELRSLANVNHERRAANFSRLHRQLGEARD